MFSIVVFGFPLDSSQKKRDKFESAIQESVVWLRRSKVCKDQIKVRFPPDLNSFDPKKGILIVIYNRAVDPSIRPGDHKYYEDIMLKFINRAMPDLRVEIYFS